MPHPEFLMVREAAEELGRHPESVWRLLRKEELGGEQIDNIWFVPREAVQSYGETHPREARENVLEKSDYFDTVETAMVLDISPESVRRLIRKGVLPGEKVHGKWVVLKGEALLLKESYLGRRGRPPKGRSVQKLRRAPEKAFAELVSIQEAAAIVGVSPETLRRAARKGELPAVKFGNRWLIERAILEDYKAGKPLPS